MIIKILLISAICGAALFALRGVGSSAQLALRRMAGVAGAVIAALSVLFPDAVTWVANRVGVAQGSNLVLYVLVITFLFVTIGLHQRIHLLERRLIRLSREFALLQADAHGSIVPPSVTTTTVADE